MRYRPMRWFGRLLPLVFALFAAIMVITIVFDRGGSHSSSSAPPLWFLVAWLAALGWNLYWWLFRMCIEVRVDGATLSWSTPLRRGEVALTDVIRIRPRRMSRQFATIELRGRRSLFVPVRYGFGQLQNAIVAGAPQATVDEH